MTPEEKHELFEKKIIGELTVEEDKTLSLLLDKDKTIAEEFRTYKEWSSYLDMSFNVDKEASDLESNLKNIGDNFFDKKQPTKIVKLPLWVYPIAASIAIVIGVYTFMNTTPSYNDFVSIPELSITQRGDTDSYTQVEVAFNSGNYKEAETYLSALILKNPQNSEFKFYYGLALLEQDKHDQATIVFEKIQRGTSIYKYRSLWFEALSQLKQKEIEKCEALLKKIPKEAEDYQKAQKLLQKL